MALINVFLAQFSPKTINTETFEAICLVQASSAIKAGFIGTVVNVYQTVAAFKSISALASVTTRSIDAFATVATRCRHRTLINVFLAKSTGESQRTGASVVFVVRGWGASGSIRAVVADTRVHLFFAGLASEGRLANTAEIIDMINTSTIVLARPEKTIVSINFAVFAFKTGLTLARIRVEKGVALAAVLTRIGLAQIHLIFAAFPFVTIFAFAYEFVEPILTNTSVSTGVRGAFINV